MAKTLDDFLGGEDETPAPVIEAGDTDGGIAEPVEAIAVDPAVQTEAKEPAAEIVADAEPEDVTGLKGALRATRKERADYKGERDRLKGEADELRKQLEEARKAPQPVAVQTAAAPLPAAPAPREQPMPNPAEDPQGYHRWQAERFQADMFNERLNMSEAMLRQQHPPEDVDAKMAVFKAAMATNPALVTELKAQAHPYQFAYKHAQKLLAMQEVGDDPAAYRARVEAELRAKWEAERGEGSPVLQEAAPQRPAVNVPTSLGTARSAAPRNGGMTLTIPEDFDDILRRPKRA